MGRKALLASLAAIAFAAAASAQPNVLVNGDFETNPPATNGNNSGYSISPWVLGSGNQSNVVKVDGPGGYDYGSNGPESDASAPGANIPQHYLDIVNGSNDFYQSFTPPCSGQVTFGGYFDPRQRRGNASVTLREGVGLSGNVVGQTNNVGLSGGNSRTDPWTLASFTAYIESGSTYTFVVRMENNLNFDNGFVRYETVCELLEPCCPPWNSSVLEDMFVLSRLGIDRRSLCWGYSLACSRPKSGPTSTTCTR